LRAIGSAATSTHCSIKEPSFGMTRIVHQRHAPGLLSTVLLIGIAALITGCQQGGPAPPLASSDMYIDKPRIHQSLMFTVPNDARDVNRGLMVALTLPRTAKAASALIETREPAIHLQVVEMTPAGLTPVELEDFDAIFAGHPNAHPVHRDLLPAQGGNARLHKYAHDSSTDYILGARFPVHAGGHYVATLTTVADLPELRDVPVHVRVDEFYIGGK
jgi:hypothetical protein